jgi:hypothetical protein
VASKNVIDILIKATNQTKQGLTEPIKDLDTLQKAAGKIGPAFTAASAAAAVALGIMLKRSIDAADAVKQMSDRSGASAEFLSAMGHAAEQSDTSLESLGLGAKEINELLAAANSGVPEAAEQFKAYGIEIKNADGSLKSMEQILPEVSDLVAGAGSAAEKSAIAAQFFGKKVGPELVPLLQSGSRGLADMTTEAKALGLVISDETATAAAQFNDDLDKLSGAQRGFANIANGELAPALSAVSGYFVQVVKDSDAWKVAAQALGSTLSVLIKAVATLGAAAVQTFSTIGNGLAGIGSAIASAASGDFGGAKTALNAMTAEIAAGWRDIGKIWSAEIPKEAEAGAERVKVANVKAIEEMQKARAKAAEEARRMEERNNAAALATIEAIHSEWERLHLSRLRQLEIERDAELAKLDAIQGREGEVALARMQVLENFNARKLQLDEEEAQREAEKKAADELKYQTALQQIETRRLAEEQAHKEQIEAIRETIDYGGSLTTGLVAGMTTFTDKSIAGNKKIQKSMENMWQGFRDALLRALIYKAAQETVSWATTLVAAKFGAAKLAAIWAPAATASAIATAGGTAAAAPIAIAGSLVATEAVFAAATGQAHSGMENIPREGSWVLQRGERVVQPEQNVLLSQFLETWKQNGAAPAAKVPNITLTVDGREFARIISEMGEDGRLTLPTKVIRG